MEDKEITLEELLRHHRELEMACQIWMAANDAKDERIQQLEEENSRLRNKLTRLGRAARRSSQSQPRVIRLVRQGQ